MPAEGRPSLIATTRPLAADCSVRVPGTVLRRDECALDALPSVAIRISSKDLDVVQKHALMDGIPYQTLISSILHKYVWGRLKEEGA